jgi:flagellar protein FliO/FliZ
VTGLLVCTPAVAAAATHHRPPPFHQDTTPLPAAVTAPHGSGGSPISVGSSSGEIVRTIVGLAVVLGVIYGLYWLLRSAGRARSGQGDRRIAVIATTPIAQSRTLHLVRAGGEVILVGVSEQAITPLRVYPDDSVFELEPHEPAGLPAPEPPAPAQRGLPGLIEFLRQRTVRA